MQATLWLCSLPRKSPWRRSRCFSNPMRVWPTHLVAFHNPEPHHHLARCGSPWHAWWADRSGQGELTTNDWWRRIENSDEITEHLAGNQRSKWANKNLWVQRASNRHTTILEWRSCSIQIFYLPKSSDLWTSSRTKISWVNWRAKRTSSWGCGGLIVHQFFFKFLPQPCRGECLGYPGAGRTVPSQQVRRSQPQ